jgi:hypothetical protein
MILIKFDVGEFHENLSSHLNVRVSNNFQIEFTYRSSLLSAYIMRLPLILSRVHRLALTRHGIWMDYDNGSYVWFHNSSL